MTSIEWMSDVVCDFLVPLDSFETKPTFFYTWDDYNEYFCPVLSDWILKSYLVRRANSHFLGTLGQNEKKSSSLFLILSQNFLALEVHDIAFKY